MDMLSLTNTALSIHRLGGIGVIDGQLQRGLQALRDKPREALPLHTLAISVAASIVGGYFVTELDLLPIDAFEKTPVLFRDGEGYVFYRGIRLIPQDELKHQGGTQGLIDKVNNLLAMGVLVNSRTVRRELFNEIPGEATWQVAGAAFGNFWQRDSDGAFLADFHDGDIHVTVCRIPGKHLEITNHPDSFAAMAHARAAGFDVRIDSVETYPQLQARMEELDVTPGHFNYMMGKDYLQ